MAAYLLSGGKQNKCHLKADITGYIKRKESAILQDLYAELSLRNFPLEQNLSPSAVTVETHHEIALTQAQAGRGGGGNESRGG